MAGLKSEQEIVMDKIIDFLATVNIIDPETIGYEAFKTNPDKVKLFPLSAPSAEQLSESISNFKPSDVHPIANLKDATDKDVNKYRQAILFNNTDEGCGLEKTLNSTRTKTDFHVTPYITPKLCFMVTCQGTHLPGMGKQAYKSSQIFRTNFDYCNLLVKRDYGYSIKDFLLSENNVKSEWMKFPKYFLPYLLSLQYSLFKLWESWGIKPDYVIGSSFGEYGAAVMAQIITIEEAFRMIMIRIELMTKHIPEEMFCVAMMDMGRLKEILKEAKEVEGMQDLWVDISAVNSPKQTCLVGHVKYVECIAETCKKHGIKTVVLHPCHPYHSRLTIPILNDFRKTTEIIKYQCSSKYGAPKFISTVSGNICDSLDAEHFLNHLKKPTEFMAAVKTVLEKTDVTHFLEIGPHPILIQMVKDLLYNFPTKGVEKPSEKQYHFQSSLLRDVDDRVALLNGLGMLYNAGYDINWKEVELFET